MSKNKFISGSMYESMTMYSDASLKGGFSYNDAMEKPTSGYMVGGVSDDLSANMEDINESVFAIMSMRIFLRLLLASGSHEPDGVYVGGWIDADKPGRVLCLDISERYEDIDIAMKVAVSRGERYIYDVANGESIKAVFNRP